MGGSLLLLLVVVPSSVRTHTRPRTQTQHSITHKRRVIVTHCCSGSILKAAEGEEGLRDGLGAQEAACRSLINASEAGWRVRFFVKCQDFTDSTYAAKQAPTLAVLIICTELVLQNMCFSTTGVGYI